MAAPCGNNSEEKNGNQNKEKHGFHPGAAPYGNFINYYSFNPPVRRINLIPSDLLKRISDGQNRTGKCQQKVTVLDVGCNSGDLTVSLFEHLVRGQSTACTQATTDEPPGESKVTTHYSEKITKSPCHSEMNDEIVILGCDIDERLIERAIEKNVHHKNIQFNCLDIMDGSQYKSVLTTFLEKHSSDLFDLTTCFSITMWIHLHHGDQGLQEFLHKVSQRTRYLIIEPQPWKCYKSAERRIKKLGLEIQWQSLDGLKIKHDVVDWIEKFLVSDCGMKVVQYLGETEWDRRLLLLEKNGLDHQ